MKRASQSLASWAAVGLLTSAFASASTTAQAADPDPWLGKDKSLHFAAASTLAVGGYVAGVGLFDGRGYGLLTGGALAAVAGIGKETIDLAGAGDPSWKDLTWDGLGAVAGLAVVWTLDLLTRGVDAKHPWFATPVIDVRGASAAVLVRF